MPTAAIIVTSAPSRAHATAWFAPLPPGTRANVAPPTVSPGSGSRSTRATRSRFTEPTTVIRAATPANLLEVDELPLADRRCDPRAARQPGDRLGLVLAEHDGPDALTDGEPDDDGTVLPPRHVERSERVDRVQS